MKKFLLFLMFAMFCIPWAANAQTTVEIGDGTSASYYAPIGTLYNYSITEQLYTAEEIGMAGSIQSISFNYALSTAADFPIEVYMMAVEDADLSTGISLADAYLVFNGTLSVTEPGWATIVLDTPFEYDGTSNLLIGVIKGYVQWFSGSSWYYTSATNMARYTQNDNNAYDVNTTPGTVTPNRPNIQMEIVAGSGPFCAKPTHVEVNYTGGTTAEVSWTSDAASFNIDVNGTVTNGVTNPYTLSGLDLATTYMVKVQAVCGGDNGSSDWTSGTSFTTDFCMPESQCNLTFVLTDTYGDGWNGNGIQVLDVATGAVVATLANQNLDGTNGEETQTVTLAVCDGRELEFSWVSGNYVGETQYTVTDINNEVIVEGSGAGFETFTFTPNCTPVTCARPENVAINYTGGTTAEVTWDAEAPLYNIDVNGTVIEGVTSPYTLDDLELATTYAVKVQSNCNGDLSNWTNPVSFGTDLCMPENQCAITFVVTDSYGDGWNGASINVYDYDSENEEVGELLGSISNNGDAGAGESETYTLNVCDGRTIAIVWSSGSYDSEASYTITDLNGNAIYSGTGAFSGFAYEVSCVVTDCRTPSDLAVSDIGGHSVVLSWTENGPATEWVISYMSENDEEISTVTTSENPFTLTGLTPETQYAAVVTSVCEVELTSEAVYWTTDVACPKPVVTVIPDVNSAEVSWTGEADAYVLEYVAVPTDNNRDPYSDDGWYYYDNGTYAGSVGLGGGQFYWGVMFPAGTYEGTALTAVQAYDVNAMEGNLIIYNDGETAPSNEIYSQAISFTGAGDWVEFSLSDVTVDPTKNLWVVFDAADGAAYPMGTSNDDNGDANGRWVEINGTWYDMANVGVSGRANMIRAHIDLGVDPSTLRWITVNGATSPYTIEGLNEATAYYVRVKALCGGEDGESDWKMLSFTTKSTCDLPNSLEATNITSNSATFNWIGYQDNYTLRYRRTPYIVDTLFSEGFEDGIPATWTTIDNDTTEIGNWLAISDIPSTYSYYASSNLSNWAHSGSNAAASASYVNGIGAVATDQYLVTPQLTLNGTLRFFAASEYTDADEYEVLLSTTGTSIRDFNVTLQAMGGAPYGSWDEVLIDLSEYAGQQGYIAIHHVSADKYFLVIDDFGVYDMVFEDWTTVNTSENTYTVTGLTPNAEYEWQVEGINARCDDELVSETLTFTTEEAPAECTTIVLNEENPVWSTDFEAEGAAAYTGDLYTGATPRCWSVPVEYFSASADNIGEGIDTLPQIYHSFNTTPGGHYSLRIHFRSLVAMPELDESVDLGKVRMSMYVRQSYWRYKLQIGIITDMDNPEESFVPVALVNNPDKNKTYFECGFSSVKDLVGAGRYIAFKNIGSSENDPYCVNYLDDIVLAYVPEEACQMPLSYEENFEDYTDLPGATGYEPDCWEVITEDVALESTTKPQIYNAFNTTENGGYSLRMMNRCVYAMPKFAEEANGQDLTMTLNVRQPKSFYRLQVGLVDEQGEFTPVKTIRANADMEEYTVNFTNFNVANRIAFRNTLIPGTGMATDYFDYSYNYLDDILVEATSAKMADMSGEMSEDVNAILDNIEVYPNPTTGDLYIEAVDVQKVECYNQMGQLVRVYDNVLNRIALDNLTEGVYMLRITVPQGVTVRKVVKK